MLPNACKLFVLTIFTHFGSSRQNVANSLSPHVFYGKEATIREFPYFAALEGCGAAILSKKWLVTAAHCVQDPNINPDNRAWVGGERKSNSKKVAFKRVIIHPNYTVVKRIPMNDIALIELKKKLTFSDKIKPIKISNANDGTDLLFVGKGIDETGRPSRTIKKMELRRLTRQQCLEEIPRLYRIMIRPYLSVLEKINICAKRYGDMPGICLGDSGSPLTHNNELVGLASYIGRADCRNSRLNFFTNVPTYRSWIKSVTGLE